MDDDDFANLLRNQAAPPALPSFYSQPSPTLDPFANPFADDSTANPFSNAAGSSALPSANAFGGSSSLYANNASEDRLDGDGGFMAEEVAAGLPTVAEREEEREARGRVEDAVVADRAGDGIVEVSPYVQKLEEVGPYGSDFTGGTDGKEEIRSTTLGEPGFGSGVPVEPVSAFSGGFQDDIIPRPAAFDNAPSVPAFTNPYDQQQTPFIAPSPYESGKSSPYDPYASRKPEYASPYSPASQSGPLSPQTSPSRASRSGVPQGLLAPPDEMLGSTPSDSLKAAFVKKSSSAPLSRSAPRSLEVNGTASGVAPGSGANGTNGISPSASGSSEPEKKPYVFKPGGSIKRRKVEGIRQGNHARTPSALASAPPKASPVENPAPPPVPEKDSPSPQSALISTGDRGDEIADDKLPQDSPAAMSPPPTRVISSQVAEQILTASNPQEASQAVAEKTMAEFYPEEAVVKGSSEFGDPADTLEKARNVPLPESEAGTPRSGTPVQIMSVASAPLPAIERDQDPQAPGTTANLPTSSTSSKFDRVAVSPLTSAPPSAQTAHEHHFQSLSIGGSSPAMPSAGTNGSASTASEVRQASWGRAYDEPPSPEQPSSSRVQNWETPSPAMQGWTTDVPQDTIAPPALPDSMDRTEGNSGWASPGFNAQPPTGRQGDDVTDEAWGGAGYASPARVVPEEEEPPYRSAMPRSASNVSIKEGGRTRLMDQPMFTITLSDPTKVGDPIRGHIVYTVTTRTTSPHYRRAECSVLRRFSDFLWLFDAVSGNNPGVIVPPVPDKHAFGRFEEQFVETRRAALEGSLRKMANHPVLALDQDLRLFLESDSFALEIKHRRQEMTQEKQGLLAGLTGPKFNETDDWFDHRKTFLDGLEVQLKSLTRSIEASSKHRLDLAVLIDRLSESVTQLAESDLAVDLSAALQRLAGLNKKEKEMLETQAKMDVIHLMNCAEEYIRLIGSVRLAFASRIKSYFTWQTVEADSRRLKQQHEKLRRANKIPQERIQSALAEISDADRRAIDAHSDYDAVTRLVKIEFARFEAERILAFKSMLERYLEGMIERQKDFVNGWEKYHAILGRMLQSEHSRVANGSS